MSYRKIGDLIQLVDVRNKDLSITHLVGLTINKKFIPSVANTIGTDMSNYKIIRKNQFACSTMQVRRDKKMPVALLKEIDEAIISQAYPVFEVKDDNEILPDYLRLWFARSEFDREACFHAVGGVRGSLEWEDFCNMELPVPSLEKQREIVAEYQAIENKIKVNEQICEKLEATAQAIYKEWFVDFEFPDENGEPYKSSGGEMVYNEELEKEVPEGWEVKSLLDIANYKNGLAMQNYPYDTIENSLGVIKIRELGIGKIDENSDRCSNNISKDVLIENGDMIFSWSGTLKIDIWSGETAGLNQHLFKVTSIKFPKWFYYYSSKFHLNEFIRIADSNKTSLGHIKKEHLENAFVFVPNNFKMEDFNYFFCKNLHLLENIKNQNQKFTQLQSLLLSRLATLEGIIQ